MTRITPGAFEILLLFLGFLEGGAAQGPLRLVLDSDGGGDDGVAILQVLEAEDSGIAELLAVTCSYGNVNVDQACDNVRRTLNLEGKADRIPVYKGCESPLLTTPVYDNYYGDDGFGNAATEFPLPDTPIQDKHAAEAIVELANKYPGEITLIVLGPLTNIAIAYKLDYTLPSKLKQLTIMGGTRNAIGNIGPVSEFNIYDDPEAAKIVLERFSMLITMMPFENCLDYTASWDWYHQWISATTNRAYFVQQINQVAVQKMIAANQTFQCCDLQATTVVLYQDVVTTSVGRQVQVETCSSVTRGETVVDNRQDSNSDANVLMYETLSEDNMLDVWLAIVAVNDAATQSYTPSSQSRRN